MINIDNLLTFVTPYYQNKDVMHNLSHIERVLQYVNKLIKSGKYQVDQELLTYSTYFHGFIYNSEPSIVEWLKT